MAVDIVFRTPFEQYSHRNGESATVLGVASPHAWGYDPDAWEDSSERLYVVRFHDGEVITAWDLEVGAGWRTGPDGPVESETAPWWDSVAALPEIGKV